MRVVVKLSMLNRASVQRATQWVAAAGLLCAVTVAPAQAPDGLPLPVLQNEVHVLSKNGCGFVASLPMVNAQTTADARQAIGAMVWSGECPNGLASGFGTLMPPEGFEQLKDYRTEFLYGRRLPKMLAPDLATKKIAISYIVDGKSVTVANERDPFAPRWSSELFDGIYITDPDNSSVFITTLKSTCFIDQPAFRGCTLQNDYEVFGISLKYESGKEETIWCPNPRTSNGCEALWRQKGAPIFSKIQAIIDQTEKKIAEARIFFRDLTEPWIAQVAARKLAAQTETSRTAIPAAPRSTHPQDLLATDILLTCSHEAAMLYHRLRKESGPALSDAQATTQILRQVTGVLMDTEVAYLRPRLTGYVNALTREAMSAPDGIVGSLFGLCTVQRRIGQLTGAVRMPSELRGR